MRLLSAVLVSLMATTAGAHASSFVVLGDKQPAGASSFVTLGSPEPAKMAEAAPKKADEASMADPMQAALLSMKPGSWQTPPQKADADRRQAALGNMKPGSWEAPYSVAMLADAEVPVLLSPSIILLGGPVPLVTDEKVASISDRDPYFVPTVIRGGEVGGASAQGPATAPVPAAEAPQAQNGQGQTSQPAAQPSSPQPANGQQPSPSDPAAPAAPAPALPPNGYSLPKPS